MPYSETLATRRAAASQEKGGQWGEGWRMNVCGGAGGEWAGREFIALWPPRVEESFSNSCNAGILQKKTVAGFL